MKKTLLTALIAAIGCLGLAGHAMAAGHPKAEHPSAAKAAAEAKDLEETKELEEAKTEKLAQEEAALQSMVSEDASGIKVKAATSKPKDHPAH